MIQEQIAPSSVHLRGDLEEAGRSLEGPSEIPIESQPDQALIQRCQAGDMKAAEEIFHRYHGPVHNLVARMVRNGPETEDLVQDVFLKAFKGMTGFKGASSFRTWIYQIATNTCLNHLAKAERRYAHDSLEAPLGTDYDQTLGDRLPDPGPVPEEAAVTAEIYRRIGEAVDRLPADFRAVLVLRDFQDLSYEEVARALDLNLGTVKSRLARARRQVQKWVEDLFSDEPQFHE
ncbi:MAG: polymerase, sigma-24 subunit, RpoE [Cyanobacteria bacterium RYN_339]|nr:polymerase, sigma-24 subunit, RpoE [Cyanobacteria bacterium RYN_339]